MAVVKLKVYNSMADKGEPCGACAALDGTELPEEDDSVALPNSECSCDGGCACYWTWMSRVQGGASPQELARRTKRLC